MTRLGLWLHIGVVVAAFAIVFVVALTISMAVLANTAAHRRVDPLEAPPVCPVVAPR